MSINIYSVANHLEENGWRLISTEYKNLSTELEMLCPKGHPQTQTYKWWRDHMLCEKCMGAGFNDKIERDNVPPKSENTTRLLALDAATNVTGYAVYDDKKLVAYGTYKVNPILEATERINKIKHWLEDFLDKNQVDVVGIENIQLQSFGANGNYQVEMYRVLSNLQGVLVDVLFEKSLDHALAYSTVWRKYCGIGEGKGRENKKKQAQEKVKSWYNLDCTQDEADAICLGKYFCSYFKSIKNTWGEDI